MMRRVVVSICNSSCASAAFCSRAPKPQLTNGQNWILFQRMGGTSIDSASEEYERDDFWSNVV